jgi:hypothetical protein
MIIEYCTFTVVTMTINWFQHRKYVDPWDLDLREVSWRHSSDTTDCSADQVVSLSSAAGPESTRSEFVYVPGPSPKTKAGGRTRSRSVARYDCCQCSPKSSMALLPPDAGKNEYSITTAVAQKRVHRLRFSPTPCMRIPRTFPGPTKFIQRTEAPS